LATDRLRRIIATLVALLVLAAVSAAPALATSLRVEGPGHTVFQGNVKPFVGTLKGHTTTQRTALGALVTASRRTPFTLGLQWSDAFGGAWNGFFVASIAGITPPSTAFWALKVNQKLTETGIGSTPVGRRSKVLVYYTTFDPVTFATQPTLALTASSQRPEANTSVTFTVRSFDDAGTPTAAAGAWVWVNGVATQANATGTVTVRLAQGRYRVRATDPGTIRSRTLWVRAS
jgi:type 1 fimbria pilin